MRPAGSTRQVFYLRSRGISEEEARRLVVLGFFADVLDGIDVRPDPRRGDARRGGGTRLPARGSVMADVSVRLADLRDRQPRRVVIDGVQVALVRVGDEVFAVNDVCSTLSVPVRGVRCTIECWLHGSRFDLRTGDPSGPPAFEPSNLSRSD